MEGLVKGDKVHVVFEMNGREMSADGIVYSEFGGKVYVEIETSLLRGIVEADPNDVSLI